MSNRSWISSVRQSLRNLRRPDRAGRVAIVGVGHDLRGDDGAGTTVARALLALEHPVRGDSALDWLILDAGPAPENSTGPLRRFRPDLVLIVDAAEMGETPGTVRWLNWQDTTGIGVATHALPLHIFAVYLIGELGCDVALLGIQPADTMLDRPLSPDVQRAVESITKVLRSELR